MRFDPIKTKCKNLREVNQRLKNFKASYHLIYCGFMGMPGYQRRAYQMEQENNRTTMGDYFPIQFDADDEELLYDYEEEPLYLDYEYVYEEEWHYFD